MSIRYRSVTLSLDSPAAKMFDGPNSVYLSPHHDDVCFSLGGLIRRRPGGRLISLFTRSAYSLTPPAGHRPDVDAISRRRTEEDNAFAAACHLNKIDLGLADAPLSGRQAMDLSGVGEYRKALTAPLLARLQAIAAETPADERLILFCPVGIGGHANHIATVQAVILALPVLRRRYRVLFYEDLHYAANAEARQAGLIRLFDAMEGRRATRLAIGYNTDANAKLELVRLYRSQFTSLPESCAIYSPNVRDEGAGLHEAVWDFGLGPMVIEAVAPGHRLGAASPSLTTRPATVPATGKAEASPPATQRAASAPTQPYGPPTVVDGLVTDGNARVQRPVRVDLTAFNRAKNPIDEPPVSCLMVTAGRAAQARIAIDCYQRQSWSRRQLVIVDTGDDAALEDQVAALGDPSINYKRIGRNGATLGDIRNIAAGRARGDYFCVWDDDDLHHPLRIELQMTALRQADAAACALGKVTIWWPTRAELATSMVRAWEGTLLCKRDAMPRYIAKDRSEDSPAVDRLIESARVIRMNAPELYVYVRHATNTWGEVHFETHLTKSTQRLAGTKNDDALAHMATVYPIREYLAAIGMVRPATPDAKVAIPVDATSA